MKGKNENLKQSRNGMKGVMLMGFDLRVFATELAKEKGMSMVIILFTILCKVPIRSQVRLCSSDLSDRRTACDEGEKL